MIVYQGSDIPFSITLDPVEENDVQSFDEFSKIILHVYTDCVNRLKFSSVENENYQPLTLSNDKLSGIIRSNDSKLLNPGQIFIDIMLEKPSTEGDLKDNYIDRIETGIMLKNTSIKYEV